MSDRHRRNTQALVILFSGVSIGYRLGTPETVAKRVQMALSPWDNEVRGGDQLAHSLWVMSSGGLAGAGLGMGEPGTAPAAHTDLILSAAGEELGFCGFLAVILLYALLVLRSLRLALSSGSYYTVFLGIGLVPLTAFQILLITTGILGILPLSGIVSPYISWGKSSMWANFAIFGVVLSVSRESRRKELRPQFVRPMLLVLTAMSVMAGAMVAKAAYTQVLQADRIAARPTLVVQRDGFRRYQYNPRLTHLAHQIPKGSIYDRNGIPLATSSWQELDRHRSEYTEMGISIERSCSRFENRHYPFGPLTFHLLGDTRVPPRWVSNSKLLEENVSRLHLQGFDDKETLKKLIDRRSGAEYYVIRYDYSELVPVLRHRHNASDEMLKGSGCSRKNEMCIYRSTSASRHVLRKFSPGKFGV